MPTTPPTDAQKLATLIAEAKATGKATKADILEPYRAVLLKERKAGTSIRIMVGSLATLGASISEESLRLWFTRQEAPKRPKTQIQKHESATEPKRSVTIAPTAPAPGPRVARADI